MQTNSDSRLVVLFPGIRGTLGIRWIEWLIDTLSKQGYNVLALDYAKNLEATFDKWEVATKTQLAPYANKFKTIDVIAHSLGGAFFIKLFTHLKEWGFDVERAGFFNSPATNELVKQNYITDFIQQIVITGIPKFRSGFLPDEKAFATASYEIRDKFVLSSGNSDHMVTATNKHKFASLLGTKEYCDESLDHGGASGKVVSVPQLVDWYIGGRVQ